MIANKLKIVFLLIILCSYVKPLPVDFEEADKMTDCVPLSECKPYSGVLKAFENQNVVANKTQADWLAFFSQNACGFTANEQNIECPVEADGDQFGEDEELGEDLVPFSAFAFASTTTELECYGSASLDYITIGSGDFHTTRLNRKLFSKLGSNLLSGKEVLSIRVDGNCCWQIYGKENFKGEAQYLANGFHDSPDFQPKSMEKVTCN